MVLSSLSKITFPFNESSGREIFNWVIQKGVGQKFCHGCQNANVFNLVGKHYYK